MLTTWIKSEKPRADCERALEKFERNRRRCIRRLLWSCPIAAIQSKNPPLPAADAAIAPSSETSNLSRFSANCGYPTFCKRTSTVDTKFRDHILKGCVFVAAMALAACGTPAARNFGGKWKPVNHFRQHATEIPLTAAYTFYAAPLDETLKTMLTRWANDSGRELSYELPFDVTLYTPVSDIRTTDLDAAAQQLTTIYAAQGVYVSATDRKILVRPSQSTSSAIDSPAVPASSSVAAPSAPASSK